MSESPVRVMRIIEIEYPSLEVYEEDRKHWALPANGVQQFSAGAAIYKTATFLAETIGQGQLQPLDLLDEAAKDPRPDTQRGMYGKYEVHRLNDPAGKHAECRFFVLDPKHDENAFRALDVYAQACRVQFPLLANDLDRWIDELEEGRA